MSGHPRLRPFADLDLLLSRDCLARGEQALRTTGWAPVVEFNERFGFDHGHDVHLQRRIGSRSIDVELHWRIGDDQLGTALSWEALRERAQTIELAGAQVLVAGAADELQVLALHLLSDRSKRLCWAHDLALAASAAGRRSGSPLSSSLASAGSSGCSTVGWTTQPSTSTWIDRGRATCGRCCCRACTEAKGHARDHESPIWRLALRHARETARGLTRQRA